MIELARYEGRKRVRGSLILAAIIGVLGLFFASIFPSFKEAGADDIADAFPPAMQEMFGIEAMGTIEGFLAVEVYNWIWVLLVAIYFAYAGGGLLARDIESGQMDLLLAHPVSRARVLGERLLSLGVPLVILNGIVPIFIYAGVLIAGESIDPVRLVMVHLLSVPYLFVAAAIGIVLSVLVDRASIAQRVAFSLIFFLWLFGSVITMVEDLDWLAGISPAEYYDPTAILVHGSYEYFDAIVLLLVGTVLIGISVLAFNWRDI